VISLAEGFHQLVDGAVHVLVGAAVLVDLQDVLSIAEIVVRI